MSKQGWERLEELFARACDVPESAREQFAARHCADDPVLHSELLALLRADVVATGFLEAPLRIDNDATVEPLALAAGSRLGAWRIARPLGRGGMGEVYEVFRADGAFEQRAALKLLRREASAQIERFHAERNILGRLDYPGIARLLDGGVATDGRPWAVLEYVEGQTITAWCAARSADLTARLGLFTQVCEAVAYAHSNLIVHRDLKPSNILVDATGRVRLLDFGIAKLIDPASGAASDVTQLPLTPDYCAPEQLAGGAVTTATDVYALGVLLYELLTGAKPWSAQGLPLARAVRMLTEASAPKPSSVAATNSTAPVPARLLRGDLDAIVARCLRKEPAYRYATVDALKQDIDCYLQGRTVAARDGTRLYAFGRFVRRYRWGVAGVATLILALAGGIAATVWQAKRAEQQAARAEAEVHTSNAVKNFLTSLFKAAGPEEALGRKLSATDLLDAGFKRVESELEGEPQVQVELLATLGRIYLQLKEYEQARVVSKLGYELTSQSTDEQTRLLLEKNLIDSLIPDIELDSARASEMKGLLDELIRELEGLPQSRQQLLPKSLATRSDMKLILGDYPGAEADARKAVAAAHTIGDTDDALSTALEVLGDALVYQAHFDEAIKTYREAIEICVRTMNPKSPGLLGLRSNLGNALTRAEQYGEAVTLLRDVLDKQREVLGPTNRSYAKTLKFLLLALSGAGQFKEAEQLGDEAVPLFEKVYGKDSVHMATLYSRLAVMKASQGRYDAAAAYAEQELRIDEKIYPPANEQLLIARRNMTAFKLYSGDLDGAQIELDRMLKSNSEDTYSLLYLGTLKRIRGDALNAEDKHQTALKLAARVDSPAGALALRLHTQLACDQRNLGKFGAARENAKFVLDALSSKHMESSDQALYARFLIAQIDYMEGNIERALPVFEELQPLGDRKQRYWRGAEVDLMAGLSQRKLGGKFHESANATIARARKAFADIKPIDPFFVSLLHGNVK